MVRGKGKLKWMIIGVLFALMASAVWLVIWRRHESQKEQPNGFPLLVEAANQIVGVNPIFQRKPPTKEQLRKYIAANRVALQTLRKALTMPCTNPFEVAKGNVLNPFADPFLPSHWRELGHLLVAEGKWHELEGRFDQAAQSYLDTMKLGLRVKGGIVIHKLVGDSIAEMGQKSLLLIAQKLSAEMSELIAHELVQLLDEEEPFDVVLARDLKVSKRIIILSIPREIVRRPLETIEGLKELPQVLKEAKESGRELASHINLRRTAFGLTAIELALNAFERKERRLPQTLNDLVPQYLPKLPADEISKKPFVYRIVDGKAKVYSVGRNGRDEDGKGDDVTARLWVRFKDVNFRKAYFKQLLF